MLRFLHLSVQVIYYIVITGTESTEPANDSAIVDNEEYLYYYDAVGWLKIHLTPASWRDARNKCVEEGALLASPDTQKMAAAMTTCILTTSLPPVFVYTGIHDTYYKGLFYSVEGTPLSDIWARWASGEPDKVDSEESCVTMYRNGQLYDNACSETFPYICYKRELVTGAGKCGIEDMGYKYEQRTGSCYKFNLAPHYWTEAFAQCSREGAHLVVINSDLEATVIREMFEYVKFTTFAYIGFTDSGNQTSSATVSPWITIHGQTLRDAGYARWADGEPQQTGTHCGAVFEDGLLDDYFCDVELPFICEMTLPKPRPVGSNNIL